MDAPRKEEPPWQALWRARYQWQEPGCAPEPSIEATWDRVALAVSAAEPLQPDSWRERFRAILSDFCFLPGDQVLSGAGTGRASCLSSCYAIVPTEDSISGIFGALRESAVALQAGAAIGLDFSHFHPKDPSIAAGGHVTGSLSFMPLWRQAAEILQGSHPAPDSASIGLRCDHPDVESYIDAYEEHGLHPRVHRTLFVSDAFLEAVGKGAIWQLVFPLTKQTLVNRSEVCARAWSGAAQPVPCLVYKHLAANALWTRLLQDVHAHGSPRIVFMDTMQRANNLWYAEQIAVSSPCASVPLPAGGVCNRGAINLRRFVKDPYSEHPQLDWIKLRSVVAVAVRFLDDVYDISAYPSKSLAGSAHAARRLGLGITGLDGMFSMLGLRYGTAPSLDLTDKLMEVVRDTAYQTSMEIAREKGAFPAFDRVRHAASSMVLNLSHELQDAIARHGLRNSHLIAVASDHLLDPFMGSGTCGIEPAASHAVSAEDQLALAAVVQFHTDSAVAVNIHVPANTSATAMGSVMQQAWKLRLKNCLVTRAGRANGGRMA